jgi:ANTAR domain
MRWLGFREQASALGLRASVSIPVFAGNGAPVAVLNLYSHDQAAMAPVVDAIWNVFHPDSKPDGEEPEPALEPGAAELVAGLSQASAVHATIQQAVGVIMAQQGVSALDAYLTLRDRAAETNVALTTAATALLRQISN